MTRLDAFEKMVIWYATMKNTSIQDRYVLQLPLVLDAILYVQDQDLSDPSLYGHSLPYAAIKFTNYIFDQSYHLESTERPSWLPADWNKRGYNFQ